MLKHQSAPLGHRRGSSWKLTSSLCFILQTESVRHFMLSGSSPDAVNMWWLHRRPRMSVWPPSGRPEPRVSKVMTSSGQHGLCLHITDHTDKTQLRQHMYTMCVSITPLVNCSIPPEMRGQRAAGRRHHSGSVTDDLLYSELHLNTPSSQCEHCCPNKRHVIEIISQQRAPAWWRRGRETAHVASLHDIANVFTSGSSFTGQLSQE